MLHFSVKLVITYFTLMLFGYVSAEDGFSKQYNEAAFAECKLLRDKLHSSGDTKNPQYIPLNKCVRYCAHAVAGTKNVYCAKAYKNLFGRSYPNLKDTDNNDTTTSEKTSAPTSQVPDFQVTISVAASFDQYKNICAPYAGAASTLANRCVWSCRVPKYERLISHAKNRCVAAHRAFTHSLRSRPGPAQETHFYDITAELEFLSQGLNSTREKTMSFSYLKVKDASNPAFAKRCAIVVFFIPWYSDNPLSSLNRGDVSTWKLKRIAPMEIQKNLEHEPDCIVIDLGEKI